MCKERAPEVHIEVPCKPKAEREAEHELGEIVQSLQDSSYYGHENTTEILEVK